MNVTLQVNGREMTFSEQELSSILEEHFSSKTTKKAMTAEVAQKPTEDEWFEVKPLAIDQKLFGEKRKDDRQEQTRQYILGAFEKIKENPEEYGKNFKTLMPTHRWVYANVADLLVMARELGDRNANWFEQVLEWAQRIANGESWEAICNYSDTAKCYRVVISNRGDPMYVGGSVYDIGHPPSFVYIGNVNKSDEPRWTVPLVVRYE